MADTLGMAWVGISPFDDQFATKSRAIINAALRNVKANVPVTVNQSALDASIAAAVAKLAVLDAATGKMKLNLDNNDALMSVRMVRDAVEELLSRTDAIPVSLDDSAALAKISALRLALTKLHDKTSVTGPVNVDYLASQFYSLEQQAKVLEAAMSHLHADIDAGQALGKIVSLSADTDALRTRLATMRADVSDTAAEAKIAGLQVKANALSKALLTAPSDSDFTTYEATLLGLEAAYGKLSAAQSAAEKSSSGFFSALGLQGAGSLIHITDILNASLPEVQLFGGAIGMMYSAVKGGDAEMPALASHLVNVATSAHLSAEAAIEFAAVWGPAVIAVAAFGAAASPTFKIIGDQLLNMHTASMATGQAFASLATSGESVTRAVRPSVLEAFGIGLHALQTSGGTLAPVLAALGAGFDQFAARAANAFKGSGSFMKQGSADALALTQSFASLGSIFATVMKAVPGYAEVLLGFGNDVLGVGANVARGIEPALAALLKIHGALLYGGLAGSAAAFGLSKLIPVAISVAGAVSNAAASIMGDENLISRGAGSVVVALEDMSAGPVIAGVGLLAGAIAAVVIFLKASKSAAQDFNSTIQQTLSGTSVGSLPAALATSLAEANQKVAASSAAVTQALAAQHGATGMVTEDTGKTVSVVRQLAPALQQAASANLTYSEGQQQLTQQGKNLNLNLGAIAATMGTTIPGALALASGAQVTSNQLLASGGDNWAVIATEVAGYVAQLKVMTPGVGQLNSALNALNVTQSAQVTDAQKLATAYSGFIGIVTGGDSAFASFEQGQATLASDLNAGSAAGIKYTATAGNLKDAITLVGTSMNGTSASALAARQAFDSQIQAATTLYGNLQDMATVSGNTAQAQEALSKAGRDLVAQLLPMAAGSKTATAEVFALAQIAGFGGVDSFQALSKWVGNTKNAEGDLNQQTTVLTVSSANLTQAAKALATALANQVTAGEASAAAKAANLSTIQGQLAAAVENANGKFTTAAQNLAGAYYEALIKSGTGATTAKADVDAFLVKLGATPGVVNTVNAALAKLPSKVTVSVATNVSGSGTVKALEGIGAPGSTIGQNLLGEVTFTAAGGIVRGGGPAGRDSQLHMLAPGELVIPTSHAAAFADMARRAGIPGMAAGGVAGLTSELGQLVPTAANASTRFGGQMVEAFVKSALAALPTLPAGGIATPANIAAILAQALRITSTPASWLPALETMVMKESGGNPSAVDPIAVAGGEHAEGLLQTIPSTFAAYAMPGYTASPFNPLDDAVASIRYIKATYGNPGNIIGIGRPGNYTGYANGGVINEPVYGRGLASGRNYMFGERGPEAVMPASQVATAGNPGMPPMTTYQGQQIIALLQTLAKQGAQAPYNTAQALNAANGQGVRRGYFSTGG